MPERCQGREPSPGKKRRTHPSCRTRVTSQRSIAVAKIALSGKMVKLYRNASRHARQPKSVICDKDMSLRIARRRRGVTFSTAAGTARKFDMRSLD